MQSQLRLSHSLSLDMLNNFCFHVYAQKSLFIAENCNTFFFDIISVSTLCQANHRAGSQLKMSECLTKTGNQITLSHTHSLTLLQSHSLSYTHSRHTEQLLFSCLCSKVTLSHSHTISLSQCLTHSLFHSLIHSLSTC